MMEGHRQHYITQYNTHCIPAYCVRGCDGGPSEGKIILDLYSVNTLGYTSVKC